ncbi:MAG TPA: cyclase family protein [Planctomycetota bacterium]|nr:cyclase family protein [Planctomycetota bacterium]
MIYDISMPLREGMPVYDGNPPYRRVITHVLGRDGAPVNQSRFELGAHCGTHIDAPLHFEKEGSTVDAVPLENLVGPARLLHFLQQDCIDRTDLEGLDWTGVDRVLFRTRNSDHWVRSNTFDRNFVYLTGPAAQFLVERRIKLVGIDSLGIEKFGSPDHPAHHALLRAGVTILEGLYLIDVPVGDYTLFCGPLRVLGGEGAPARVLLVTR